MKDKPSEWIAISDLMAGVMAVVMLMLVVSVLQKNASEIAYKEELAKAKGSKKQPCYQDDGDSEYNDSDEKCGRVYFSRYANKSYDAA